MVVEGCGRVCRPDEPAYTYHERCIPDAFDCLNHEDGRLYIRDGFGSLSSPICGVPSYDRNTYNWICERCARRLGWLW
jgi:hypothetical protein